MVQTAKLDTICILLSKKPYVKHAQIHGNDVQLYHSSSVQHHTVN